MSNEIYYIVGFIEDKPFVEEVNCDYYEIKNCDFIKNNNIKVYRVTRHNKYIVFFKDSDYYVEASSHKNIYDLNFWINEEYFTIYSLDKKEFINYPYWNKRDDVKSVDEALELLPFKMVDSFGELSIEIKEMEKFASKWSIPFSGYSLKKFEDIFNARYPYWDSSSSKC